jgi:hypothetical protein
MDRKLTDSDRLVLLQKAADIVISAVNGNGHHIADDWPAKILEKTYDKMIEICNKN